ncbi:hypothetical protein DFS34DRAFT_627869 [Phlyctochytrium arcticum]|nr:hypothetical protein DFS34DRAFT_627869 [Phlyctochytrium arcticum]
MKGVSVNFVLLAAGFLSSLTAVSAQTTTTASPTPTATADPMLTAWVVASISRKEEKMIKVGNHDRNLVCGLACSLSYTPSINTTGSTPMVVWTRTASPTCVCPDFLTGPFLADPDPAKAFVRAKLTSPGGETVATVERDMSVADGKTWNAVFELNEAGGMEWQAKYVAASASGAISAMPLSSVLLAGTVLLFSVLTSL